MKTNTALKNHIRIAQNPEAVAEAACGWVVDLILAAIKRHDRCIIAASGGSTPKRLYQMLAELPPGKIPWGKVHLIWGDERNVPLDHPDSNFGMVREALLNPLGKRGPNVYPVPIDPSNPTKAAEYYEATVRALLHTPDHDEPLDLVLLGLGDDSHTASLFPNTQALTEKNRWVLSNWVEKLQSHRITLTPPMINAAAHVAFLVCGSSKKPALQNIWHGAYQPSQYPAQIIAPKCGELWWFVDAPSIEGLELPKQQG